MTETAYETYSCPCPRCGAEVSEWREVIGTPLSLREKRPEIMCVPCNHKFMAGV